MRFPSTPMRAAALATLVLLVPACGGDDDDAAEAPTTESTTGETTTAPAPAGDPVGIIAIGHSGLTGENSDPDHPGQKALENSWATGTAPDVNSIYTRLVAARPETEGHVSNMAEGGAPVTRLSSQLERALQEVPNPALVVIQTMDSEITCDGAASEKVDRFGATLTNVLDEITTAAPDAKMLVVGQLGRPSVAFVEELVAAVPTMQEELTSGDDCSFYDAAGQINPAGFEELTGIIESFEAEQARVCAEVPNCATDGGARAAYVDKLENFSSDYNHLNAQGNAAAAEIAWPAVAQLLELQ